MIDPLLIVVRRGFDLDRCILIWCSVFMPLALSIEKMHTAIFYAAVAQTPDVARRSSICTKLPAPTSLYASSLIKFFCAMLVVKKVLTLRSLSMESQEFLLIWIQNLQSNIQDLQGKLETLNSSLESLGFEVKSLDSEVQRRK